MAIIKRDGSREDYSEQKMKAFLTWAVEGNPCNVDTLYSELTIPTKDTEVSVILNGIADVAEKLASRITPSWLLVAGRVYTVGLIKEHRANGLDLITGHEHGTEYLLKDFLCQQLASFDRRVIDRDEDAWAKVLREALDLTYDYSLSINNVRMMCERQGRQYKGIIETPSLVLLRQSVAASEYEPGKFSPSHALSLLKASKGYTILEDGPALFTHATPMAIHAGKSTRSTGSCTLLTTADDSKAIMDTAGQLALHSKHGSGNGIDVSAIAASGRYIESTEGRSAGVKPFLKIYESILQAFNQAGKRVGAGVVTFRFWHKDFRELIFLKNTTGEAESRIRGLKYAMCTHDFLYKAAADNQEVALVCPKAAHDFFGDNRLLTSVGPQFTEDYSQIIAAVKAGALDGEIVTARSIWSDYFRNAYNHGNLYETNLDNINNQNMLYQNVYSSNLCTEVMIPSRYNADEVKTGLCFLNSTNAARFHKLTPEEQMDLAYIQVKALDNQITTDFYPVPHTTYQYAQDSRFIGIGLSNIATLFAENNLRWDSQAALEFMDKFMDDWSFAVISASVKLAEERGAAQDFYATAWSDGMLPMDYANQAVNDLTEYTVDKTRWNALRARIELHGMRNCLVMALAPTASSGAGAGLTEGQDPIEKVLFTRSGDIPVTHCVSMNMKTLTQFDIGFDIPNVALIQLAAIRQKYLDQGQSLSLFAKGSNFSMQEAFNERAIANDLGIKTIYYTKFRKMEADECESCT